MVTLLKSCWHWRRKR